MQQWTGSKLGKEYVKAVYCYLTFLTYMQMWNAWLDEKQAGIKNTARNINHPIYTDYTTLIAESEELKSPLTKVKEESEKSWLKAQYLEN